MKYLHNQHPFFFHVGLAKVHGQFDQVCNASGIGRFNTRQIGCHVRHNCINLFALQKLTQLLQYRWLAKITLQKMHPLNRLHGQQVDGHNGSVELPHGSALRRQPAAHILAPCPGCTPEIHHAVSGPNQLQGLVDFLELVGRTGTIALFLGHLDVGVVDVVVEPRLVDLFAFGLNLQSGTCLGRDNNAMPAIQLTPAQRKEHRALAHHLDDQAETVLMNLLRGAGLRGAAGMAPQAKFHGKHIVRPLLSMPREAILAYARERKLDWIEPLPLDLIPNRVNLEDRFLSDAWNFGGTYSLPWQSGMTGIAFNPKLTGRDLSSFDDLLDPQFKGKVALLTEMRDSLGLAMLSMGKDPSVLDEDAMNAALDKIEKATKDGQFRAFTGNEYLRSLQSGDFVACMAWSGDMQQLGYTRPDIKFVLPDAGAMAWYDTMIIPKGAPNGVAAAKWMNYVYDPVNAAKITAYVQYASPVKGVKEELVKMGGDAAKLAESPLIFPDAEMQKKLHIFAAMPDDVDARITARFLKITNG